jgi:antitoxin CptB
MGGADPRQRRDRRLTESLTLPPFLHNSSDWNAQIRLALGCCAAISPEPGPSGFSAFGAGMTGSTISSEGLDARRRKLLFRSWHRGTREADLIMGRFADAHIGVLSDGELDQYEHLLDALETELLAWLTGVSAVPAEHDTAMLRRLRDFHFKAGR